MRLPSVAFATAVPNVCRGWWLTIVTPMRANAAWMRSPTEVPFTWPLGPGKHPISGTVARPLASTGWSGMTRSLPPVALAHEQHRRDVVAVGVGDGGLVESGPQAVLRVELEGDAADEALIGRLLPVPAPLESRRCWPGGWRRGRAA